MSNETQNNENQADKQNNDADKKLTVDELEDAVGGTDKLSAGTKSKILVGGVGNYSEGE